MGQLNLCVETVSTSFGGGVGGGMCRGERGAAGEGFRSHRCKGLLYAWC